MTDDVTTSSRSTRYVDFVTNMMLIFGVAFEFPLIVLMLNFAGVVSAKRLLGWWRIAVFLFFVFAAIVTPDAGPVRHDRAGAVPVGALLRRGRRRVPQRQAHAAAARRSTPASTTTRSRRSRTTASRSTAGAPDRGDRPGGRAASRSTRRYDDDIT